MALKQFTFTVPKSGSPTGQASTSFASQSSDFTSSPRSPTSPSVKSPDSIKSNNPLDWNSLTSFDPAMLNLLDEGRQSTATDGARQMDFSFGPSAGLTPNASFTTIASNPLFMSYASAFDSASPIQDTNDQNNGFFDLNGLTWSPPPQQQDTSSLDDLFAGYMTRGLDYSFMPGPSSLTSESPVNHHANVSNVTHSPASSSPSSSISDPLFETRDGSASESDTGHFPEVSNIHSGCPRTKGELARKIESSGMSPFAPPLGPNNVRKSDSAHGPMITCTGTTTTLPKTQKSDDNIEVLSAWRSITSNPKFKVSRTHLNNAEGKPDLSPSRTSIWIVSVQSLRPKRNVMGRKSFWSLRVSTASSRVWRSQKHRHTIWCGASCLMEVTSRCHRLTKMAPPSARESSR